MDLSDFLIELQKYLRLEPTLIIGTGLSCSVGLPGMTHLSAYLNTNINSHTCNIDIVDEWRSIYSDVLKNGLEAALLSKTVSTKLLDEIIKLTYRCVNDSEKKLLLDIDSLKNSDYKFPALLKHLFNSLSPDTAFLDVITPNYDRLVELSCEICDLPYTTGFSGGIYKYYSDRNWSKSYCQNPTIVKGKVGSSYSVIHKIRIFKPHGSLGWKEDNDGKFCDCEHELPGCNPTIITPGTSKYEKVSTNFIFDAHRTRAMESISQAKSLIFIGYGFNDDHLQTTALHKIAQGIPVLVLTKTLSDKALKIVNEHPRIMAVSDNNDGRTKVVTDGNEYILHGDFWSINSFIKCTIL